MEKEKLLYNKAILAERLKKLRIEEAHNKLTLEELSKKMEDKTGIYISTNTLGKYEKAEEAEKMKIDNLIAFANFYDVSLDYLLGKTDSKRNNFKDQMASKHFSLTDSSIKQLLLLTKNKSFNNNEFKLKLINYIIESNDLLEELSTNFLNYCKTNKNSIHENEKFKAEVSRYMLSKTFEKFIDSAYEKLWHKKTKTLFEIDEKKINKKKR